MYFNNILIINKIKQLPSAFLATHKTSTVCAFLKIIKHALLRQVSRSKPNIIIQKSTSSGFWRHRGRVEGGNFAIVSRIQNLSFCFFASIPKRNTQDTIHSISTSFPYIKSYLPYQTLQDIHLLVYGHLIQYLTSS